MDSGIAENCLVLQINFNQFRISTQRFMSKLSKMQPNVMLGPDRGMIATLKALTLGQNIKEKHNFFLWLWLCAQEENFWSKNMLYCM